MSDEIPIVIPSHLRAGDVKTIGHVLDPEHAEVCVPEGQLDAYRRLQPDLRLVAHPDSVRGLAAKRQWMYERWGDLFMLDDDMLHCWHFEHPAKPCDVDPGSAYDLIQRLYHTALDLDCYLFAFSSFGDPRNYIPQIPFRLNHMPMGGSMGIRQHPKLAFNPAIVAKDDYWIALLHAAVMPPGERAILIDDRYVFTSLSQTFKATGGSSDVRTSATEQRDSELLRAFFGREVVGEKVRTHRNKASGHASQITVRLPWR
ncbi:MAG: hypothetical protein AAFZ07_25590 [Actinomycetota bacterium]